ncbi:Retrovirus-related Pol poly from transposon TNT 1-94 [Scomber scombrus]|uniref:Retrovirus-related Pol poly from transposon TNT 1-94 n=1 Tax=Scomber scombrus TaxID=13677 RepID=A0AAV1NGE7_SCOSC
MKEGESLTEHLKRMKELTDKLGGIGAIIEEEDQIVTLLGSLPSSYATIVTALETKMDNLTLQFVQQALINEEQIRVQADDNGAASGGASAMSTQVRGDMQPNSKAVGADRSSLWRCYTCGQEGHIKRDCPRGKKKKKIHKAKSMMCEDTEESSESAFVVKETNQNEMSQQAQWLIDSGASKHMTCYKECLFLKKHFPMSVDRKSQG